MKKLKKFLAIIISISIYFSSNLISFADPSSGYFWPEAPEISSDAGIVIDANSGAVLFSKNMKAINYPASITKLMTVLLVLENCSLDDVVTFSHEAVFSIEPGSSHIAINVGEQLSVEQCLYGILLGSANEVSNAVGEHVGNGDIDVFIEMMNQKAKDLGCVNTHFMNPHGLHDKDHYTCPYDMALITKELLRYDTFRTISGSASYVIPPTNIQPETRYLNNTHKMISDKAYLYEGVEGGKTGFTDQALNTLVTYAKRDNIEVIVVTMHGNLTHYSDTKTLLDYSFNNFKAHSIAKNEPLLTVPQNSSDTENGFFSSPDSIVTVNSSDNVVLPKTVDFSDAKATIHVDTSADGKSYIEYTYNNMKVGIGELKISQSSNNAFDFTKENVVSPLSEKIFKIVVAVVVIVALLLLGLYIRKIILIRRHKNRFTTKKTILNFKK